MAWLAPRCVCVCLCVCVCVVLVLSSLFPLFVSYDLTQRKLFTNLIIEFSSLLSVITSHITHHAILHARAQVGIYKCNSGLNQVWTYNASAGTLQPHIDGNLCLSDTLATDVWVYSNAAEVEVWVNGRSGGRQAVPSLGNAIWPAVYTPGSLVAVVRGGGYV